MYSIFKVLSFLKNHRSLLKLCTTSYLNVVSSLWLEYPLELRTCRFDKFCVDFEVLRDWYDGLCLREELVGEFSDDVDVSSCSPDVQKQNQIHYHKKLKVKANGLPRWLFAR